MVDGRKSFGVPFVPTFSSGPQTSVLTSDSALTRRVMSLKVTNQNVVPQSMLFMNLISVASFFLIDQVQKSYSSNKVRPARRVYSLKVFNERLFTSFCHLVCFC